MCAFCSVNTEIQHEQHFSSGLLLCPALVGKELPLIFVVHISLYVSVGRTQEEIPAIPGAPGRDYPAYTTPPRTSFTCEGLSPGYYSDPEGECQVYHHCTQAVARPSFTRLCPIGNCEKETGLISSQLNPNLNLSSLWSDQSMSGYCFIVLSLKNSNLRCSYVNFTRRCALRHI